MTKISSVRLVLRSLPTCGPRMRAASVALLLGLMAACGSSTVETPLGDSNSSSDSCSSAAGAPSPVSGAAAQPTMADVAGSYTATCFLGGGYDILARGGSLDLTLGTDGTVAGSMHVPADAGGPLDADMAGTYTLDGSSLTFEQEADTFVRDATWTWSDGVLEGSWSGASGSVAVRLEATS